MRIFLSILLLTATAAMAQSQPAPADKPFIYDGSGLNGFTPPTPITIITGPGQTFAPSQSSAPAAGSDAKTADKPGNVELRRTMPDLQKPEAPKPAPKGFG
jgi:hypothetical protein